MWAAAGDSTSTAFGTRTRTRVTHRHHTPGIWCSARANSAGHAPGPFAQRPRPPQPFVIFGRVEVAQHAVIRHRHFERFAGVRPEISVNALAGWEGPQAGDVPPGDQRRVAAPPRVDRNEDRLRRFS